MLQRFTPDKLTMRELQGNVLRELSKAPFGMEVLKTVFARYSQPVHKVWNLVGKGILLRLKRGMFCVSPQYSNVPADVRKVANLLYSPSYVSFETMLGRYGLIPERVVEIVSAVTGRGRTYENGLGRFSYQTVPARTFAIGVTSVDGALVACQEKALCDFLDSRPNLRISSPKTLRSYLEEDVRFDFDAFGKPDMKVISAYAAAGRKPGLFLALERMFA